jgi:pSer/pThr/pTyr-binding forkhead associated (FHA) protein
VKTFLCNLFQIEWQHIFAFKSGVALERMSDPKPQQKKSFSPDWLVRGVLTRLGDTFDRLTGRGWKPSSSLATSELIERMKKLLDSEIREVPGEGRFVPHNIKLKMQWDKFSTDAGGAIAKLEHELLAAAVDHINDSLYHTYAPLKLEIKPDYFIQGVKLLASFEKFADEEHEAELNVTVPGMNIAGLAPAEEASASMPGEETYTASFETGAGSRNIKLVFARDDRKSVGRAGSNDLSINDQSVSNIHGSLVLNPESQLIVADTGSTNGTFINGERISYGKAYPVTEGDVVRFGTVDVRFAHEVKPAPLTASDEVEIDKAETIAIGEFEFRRKLDDTDVSPAPPVTVVEENDDKASADIAPIPKPEHLTRSFQTGPKPPLAPETPPIAGPDEAPVENKEQEDR